MVRCANLVKQRVSKAREYRFESDPNYYMVRCANLVKQSVLETGECRFESDSYYLAVGMVLAGAS